MAGYSTTPLAKKLGIKSGDTIYILNPPPSYFDSLSTLPDKVNVKEVLKGQYEFIHLFVKDLSALKRQMQRSKKFMKQNGMLWISWPKKASGIVTELNENVIRHFGLSIGLVDVKVCAVDEIWSGLKFVIPLKDRT
jgi:hypothetical protein